MKNEEEKRKKIHSMILAKLEKGDYTQDEMDELMKEYTTMVMSKIHGEDKKNQSRKGINSELRKSFMESLKIDVQDTVQDFRKTKKGILRSIRDNKPKKMSENMPEDKELE